MSTPFIADADRVVEYAPVASTGPFDVPFPVFEASGVDLFVTLDGGEVGGWTASATTSPGFYGAPSTFFLQLTFEEPITGALVIEGRRAPRRVSQYDEGRGVPARDHNTELNTLTAIAREQYRRQNRLDSRLGEVDAAVDTAVESAGEAGDARDEAVLARNDVYARYLGELATDPATRLDGSPLEGGEWYVRPDGTQRVYSSGSETWSNAPQGPSGADGADGAGIGVATRTALKALDTSEMTSAYLTEAGREGMFVWRAGNYAALVTADTREGIYIKADAVAASSGAWVRVRPARAMNVEWFGTATGGAANNSAAIQCAVNVCQAEGGGAIFFGGYYRVVAGITVTGNDVRFVGRDRSSGIYSDTAGKQLLKFGGSTQSTRCAIENFILNMPVFTTSASDYVLWGENIVQFYMKNVRILGGYYCMALTGGACADNTFINCHFLFSTGTAMVYAADSTDGVNGAHHFYRCLFNQPYGTATPGKDSAWFEGARANSTAYSVNDIVILGNYYLQCSVAGTSGAAAPTLSQWYGEDITDGTVTWRLVAHTAYTGITFNTNVYYCTIRECDFTSPFQFGIRLRNSFSGTPPQTIRIEQCTCHGPISMGIYIEAGRQIHIQSWETWNATDGSATTYGVFVSSGADDIKIISSEIFGFDHGVHIDGDKTLVSGSTITNCGNGVRVVADRGQFRIIGNNLGTTARWGANTNAVNISSGTSDYYIVTGNTVVGASTGISDGGSGTNKTVSANH